MNILAQKKKLLLDEKLQAIARLTREISALASSRSSAGALDYDTQLSNLVGKLSKLDTLESIVPHAPTSSSSTSKAKSKSTSTTTSVATSNVVHNTSTATTTAAPYNSSSSTSTSTLRQKLDEVDSQMRYMSSSRNTMEDKELWTRLAAGAVSMGGWCAVGVEVRV